jgi:hypothetical protein
VKKALFAIIALSLSSTAFAQDLREYKRVDIAAEKICSASVELFLTQKASPEEALDFIQQAAEMLNFSDMQTLWLSRICLAYSEGVLRGMQFEQNK